MKKPRGRPKGTKRFDIYYTIRIDAEIQDAIAEFARVEDRPVASMTRVLLKEAIARRREGKKPARPNRKGEK